MRSKDIEAFCKSLKNKLLEKPQFLFKQAWHMYYADYDDTQEFAELLNKFLERTYLDKPLREELIKKQNEVFSLVKRVAYEKPEVIIEKIEGLEEKIKRNISELKRLFKQT